MSNLIKETARGYDVLRAEDLLLSSGKVFINGEVNTESMNELLMNLMVLENDDSIESVEMYINTPGGSVHDGLQVFDYVQTMTKPVHTVITGTGYSMGALLFLCSNCGKRSIFENGRLMLHDPSYGTADISGKKPHEIQTQLDKLMETREILAGIISRVTGKSLEDVYEITRDDTYYNSEEALKAGLATDIIHPAGRTTLNTKPVKKAVKTAKTTKKESVKKQSYVTETAGTKSNVKSNKTNNI